jgi:hypothetical protein
MESCRTEWYHKEVTIQWRTSKDDDKEVEMIPSHLGLLIDPKRDISVWSSDWPKEWLFSVQSSSTEPKSDSSASKVVQQQPHRIEVLQGARQPSNLKEGWCPSLWIDTHLSEMMMKTIYGFKRRPSVKSNDDLVSSTKTTQRQVNTKVFLK